MKKRTSDPNVVSKRSDDLEDWEGGSCENRKGTQMGKAKINERTSREVKEWGKKEKSRGMRATMLSRLGCFTVGGPRRGETSKFVKRRTGRKKGKILTVVGQGKRSLKGKKGGERWGCETRL